MTGTVYGLGIGPGDPDLITVKARAILARVPVIAYPAPDHGESLVRAIADPHIPSGRTEIVIRTPMAVDRFPAEVAYERAAIEIGAHADAGRDVAILCEGDPFFYGSFMYLFRRLADLHRVEVVPGVSSLCAVAAAAGVPLVSREECLTVLPATIPEAELSVRLAGSHAAAIMKVGRHLPKVRRILERLGLEDDAWYVERATMTNQRVVRLARMTDAAAPYFSMILVRNEAKKARIGAPLPAGTAILVVTSAGLDTARQLATILPEARIHTRAGRAVAGDVTFVDTASHARELFAEGVPLVGVCAAAILVRALSPIAIEKTREPPVLAVAEDLSVVVPLLGGHHGGHALARAIAAHTGAFAAITAAGDLRFGVAVDDPPAGWRVANPAAAKSVTAARLAGDPVALRTDAGDDAWLRTAEANFADDAPIAIRITDRTVTQPGRDLVLHPPVLCVGVGCERGIEPEALIGLVRRTLDENQLAPEAVACVASIDIKADEAAVHAVAADLGVPARFFAAGELEMQTPRLANPSAQVFREVGCHGVAEAACLAAAGPQAELVVAKVKESRATCAVARSPRDIEASTVGKPRGRLVIVGIGPGDADWRTPEATRAISDATDLVGYRPYLDLLGNLAAGKRRHAPPMTEEESRARLALDLAGEGRSVALVSSGDAGIYGMATLVFELMEREDRPQWRRLDVGVAPGISALQAAAARIGAPIAHDFCAISLSDLLTPWADIERRLRAAAEGDFIAALYNPVSQRRNWQLAAARDILSTRRPPDTPVVLGRNLGRDGETVEILRLADLAADGIDMLTLVLVGSSRTRVIERGGRSWVYTPRGYHRKVPADLGGAAS